jgi:hypothetical protein
VKFEMLKINSKSRDSNLISLTYRCRPGRPTMFMNGGEEVPRLEKKKWKLQLKLWNGGSGVKLHGGFVIETHKHYYRRHDTSIKTHDG